MISSTYQSLFRAPFDEEQWLHLIRRWLKQPPQLSELVYIIPQQYLTMIVGCRRIAQHHDINGELIDLVIVHVRAGMSWQYKQHIRYALVLRALRKWSVLPDFRAVVAYVVEDGSLWQMQYIEQNIESHYDQRSQSFKTRQHVSAMHRYLLEMHEDNSVSIPFLWWDELANMSRAISSSELKEACMPLPANPTEAFRQAYEQGIAALDSYTQALQQTYQHVGFSERAQLDKQRMQLNQYASQWDQAAKSLQHFLETAGEAAQLPDANNQRTLNLNDDWTHQTVVSFQHRGRKYAANSWPQVYVSVIELMLQEYGVDFIEKMNLLVREKNQKEIFARDSTSFSAPKSVQGWYFATHGNSNMMRDKIRKIYQVYQFPYSEFVAWVIV